MSNKICFISCVNNEDYYSKCRRHIVKLVVPDGFEVELFPVRDATSMTSGYNSAMASTNARYKVYLHQDTYITDKDFIKKVIATFTESPSIGIIGVIGSADTPDGVWWNGDDKYGVVRGTMPPSGSDTVIRFKAFKKDYQEVSLLDGLIMATQYDVPWNEDVFDGWHFYDASQCAEFRKAGYKVVVINQTSPMCFHDAGSVINMVEFEHYRREFLDEYGGCVMTPNRKPDGVPTTGPMAQYYNSERREVLACIPGKPQRILDIGCARGNFGRVLKSEFGAHVTGVEVFEKVALEARAKLDRVIISSVETPGLFDEFKEEFDLIVANDVLEHLLDPWTLVARLKDNLKSGGYMVASIPNVRSVAKHLVLRGTWDYMDAGVLDRTHLRFFTRQTMIKMFTNAGYNVERVEGLTKPKSPYKKLLMALFGEFRTIQYCVVARKL